MKKDEKIIFFYTEKLSLYRQLLTLTESIRNLAQEGEAEQIPAKTNKRQDIINRIKTIDERLGPKQKIHESIFDEMKSENKAQVLYVIKSIRKIIKTISDINMEIWVLINHEKETVADDLKKVSAGHKLVKKYAPSYIKPPAYFSMSA